MWKRGCVFGEGNLYGRGGCEEGCVLMCVKMEEIGGAVFTCMKTSF
jgi:hypothetical protein